MWLTWLKTALAGLLAFAAVAGLFAVLHDRPYVYPVLVRTGWLTGYVRATPRHIAIGGWRTRDLDFRGRQSLYWDGAGLDVYTETLLGRDERGYTDDGYRKPRHALRAGELGVRLAQPGVELLVPTWLAVVLGVTPFGVVVVGRLRSRGRTAEGQCPTCGYDLRATPGRCPECGTAAVAGKLVR